MSSQYTGAFITGVAQLGLTAVLARLLTPSEFGLIGLALVYVGLANLLSQFGLSIAIIRLPELTPRYIRAGFTIAMLLGLLCTVIVWLTAPLVARIFAQPQLTPYLHALSLLFVIGAAGSVAEAISERNLAWRRLMWVDVAAFMIGNAIPAIILAFLGYGAWALVGSQLSQRFVRSTLLVRAQPHPKFPRLGPEIRELLRFGSGFTLARGFNYIAFQGDNLVVGRVLGVSALGFYGRAFKLMMFPVTYFATIVTKVLFPVMARLQSEPGRLRSAYYTGSSLIAIVSAPLSALMVVTAPEIVGIILGPKWTPAIVPFQILTAGIMMRNSYLMAYCLDGALGAMYKRTIRDGVYATAVVLGSLVGSRFGLAGVATGVLLAISVNYFLGAILSLSMIGGSWADYFRSQAPGLGLGILAAAVAVPMRLGLHSLGVGKIAVLGGTLVITVGVIGLAIFFVPSLAGQYGRHTLRLITSSIAGQPLPKGVAWVQAFFQGLERRWADAGD